MESWKPLFKIILFSLTANTGLCFIRCILNPYVGTISNINDIDRKIDKNVMLQFSDNINDKEDVHNDTISKFRKEYSTVGIKDDSIKNILDPIHYFKQWFDEACIANVLEPNAMCLSTCYDNKPSSRMVLMKGLDHNGFVWYTNYNSRKSFELINNPHASLTFWWGELERSVRVEGLVEKVSETESDSYFQSRPRGSQEGAWISNQSEIINNRIDLEKQAIDIHKKYSNEDILIPRPQHWGGFRLIPTYIEFWKGRESRLHDRIVFKRDIISNHVNINNNNINNDNKIISSWKKYRLQP